MTSTSETIQRTIRHTTVVGRKSDRIVYGNVGPMMVSIWGDTGFDASIITELSAFGDHMDTIWKDGLVNLVVMRFKLKIPDRTESDRNKKAMRDRLGSIRAMAFVIEGSGFLATATRLGVAALSVVNPKVPQAVFTDIPSAVRWLNQHMPLGDVEAAIHGARTLRSYLPD